MLINERSLNRIAYDFEFFSYQSHRHLVLNQVWTSQLSLIMFPFSSLFVRNLNRSIKTTTSTLTSKSHSIKPQTSPLSSSSGTLLNQFTNYCRKTSSGRMSKVACSTTSRAWTSACAANRRLGCIGSLRAVWAMSKLMHWWPRLVTICPEEAVYYQLWTMSITITARFPLLIIQIRRKMHEPYDRLTTFCHPFERRTI